MGTTQAPPPPQRVDMPKGYFESPVMATQKIEKKEEIIQTESHYNWNNTVNATKKIRFEDEQSHPNQTQGHKRAQSAQKINKTQPTFDAQPTLKTIVESHFCPPVMVFQKKKQAVAMTATDGFPKENYDAQNISKPQFTSTGTKFRGTQPVKPRPDFNQTQNLTGNLAVHQPHTVLLLPSKDTNTLFSQLQLPTDKSPNLLDTLFSELILLRNTQAPLSPQNNEEAGSPTKFSSLKKSSFAKLDVNKSDKSDSNSLASPSFPLTRSKSYSQPNAATLNQPAPVHQLPPKDLSKNLAQYKLKNEEPEEEYSQNFESLSISQNLSSVDKSKSFGDNKGSLNQLANKAKADKTSVISESYPDDFETSSQNFSVKIDPKAKKSSIGNKAKESQSKLRVLIMIG
jgi:hypothetical protein